MDGFIQMMLGKTPSLRRSGVHLKMAKEAMQVRGRMSRGEEGECGLILHTMAVYRTRRKMDVVFYLMFDVCHI
jgi:hypothetical protein